MRRAALVLIAAGVGLAGCGGGGEAGGLSGSVAIDGSSTVYPITEAMAEEFQRANRGVRVTVGVSGTGGGFKKFCRGETDISDASRLIKESEEELCAENGVDYRLVPVGLDGLTVAVNPENDWASCVTTDELRSIWQPGSEVDNWSDVRDSWPDQELPLFGPGTDSGTFDYFTEAIMGEEDASRSDYSASEDDNVTLMGVSRNLGAMGYFGFAYYIENQDQVKALEIDDGSGCVAPTRETIEAGEYQPLSRPLFIYVREQALERPEVRSFVDFYLANATQLIPEVGYVPYSSSRYDSIRSELPGGGSPDGGEPASGAGDGASAR
jgi:phosphate transport system substrate-binding protein